MGTFSHSKLQTYEQCALKYKFRYIDKVEVEEEETVERLLGTCVHAALEYLYNKKIEGTILEIDGLVSFYVEIWKKHYNDKIVINNNDLNAEDYFNKGIKFITSYYSRNFPFDEKTIATEKKILLTLNEDHNLIGYVDRLALNEKENAYEIHDYKTGAFKNAKQLAFDRQLALYSLALKEEFNDGKNILMIWHYLDHDEKVILTKTNKELEKLRADVLELIEEIEQTTVFPYNKGPLCNWCEYKSICPAWQKQKTLGEF